MIISKNVNSKEKEHSRHRSAINKSFYVLGEKFPRPTARLYGKRRMVE
jgi:hypothetical protein